MTGDWISVSDSLPLPWDDVLWVLVFDDEPMVTMGHIERYSPRTVHLLDDTDEPLEQFTHWMPLPEPPKGD